MLYSNHVFVYNRFDSNRAPDVSEYLTSLLRVIRDDLRLLLNCVILDNALCQAHV